jgi:hypothetical protein
VKIPQTKIKIKLPKESDGKDATKLYTLSVDGFPHLWPEGLYQQVVERENTRAKRKAIVGSERACLLVQHEFGKYALYFHKSGSLPAMCPQSGTWNDDLYMKLPEGTSITYECEI